MVAENGAAKQEPVSAASAWDRAPCSPPREPAPAAPGPTDKIAGHGRQAPPTAACRLSGACMQPASPGRAAWQRGGVWGRACSARPRDMPLGQPP